VPVCCALCVATHTQAKGASTKNWFNKKTGVLHRLEEKGEPKSLKKAPKVSTLSSENGDQQTRLRLSFFVIIRRVISAKGVVCIKKKQKSQDLEDPPPTSTNKTTNQNAVVTAKESESISLSPKPPQRSHAAHHIKAMAASRQPLGHLERGSALVRACTSATQYTHFTGQKWYRQKMAKCSFVIVCHGQHRFSNQAAARGGGAHRHG